MGTPAMTEFQNQQIQQDIKDIEDEKKRLMHCQKNNMLTYERVVLSVEEVKREFVRWDSIRCITTQG